MAKQHNQKQLYIDKQPVNAIVWELEAYRDTYTDFSWSNSVAGKLHTSVKIHLLDDTEIVFKPKAYELKEDSIHLYGLLESLFPYIAREYYMEDWKGAYLDYIAWKKKLASQSLHRYTIDKNDNRFNTKEAKAFKAGYDSGKKV